MKLNIPGFYKILLLLFAVTVMPLYAYAQPVLERISVTERADGGGFVLRYHLTEPVDSFKVVQAEMNRVQMLLYSSPLQAVNYRPPDDAHVIKEIEIIELDQATGFDLFIHEDFSFTSSAYFDVNQTDILLSLEHANRVDVQQKIVSNEKLFQVPGDRHQPPDVTEEIYEEEVEENQARLETGETSKLREFLNTRNPATLNRITPGDPMELYMRAVFPDDEHGNLPSYLLRPVNIHQYKQQTGAEVHPWLDHSYFSEQSLYESNFEYRLYSPVLFTSNNSELPMGQNDGILWQGRGTNYFMTAGAAVQYGPFTAVFRPQFAYSENLDFTVEQFDISVHPRYGGLEFQMYLTHADIPLRFGDNTLSEFDLGDSFIQVEYKGFAGGISNERIWTGPAIHNSLIFSNHAPGFLHGFVATNEPYSTSWGNFEGKWLWGGIKESEFYDEDPANDLRYVSALSMNYSPSFIPGLYIGFTRAAYSYYNDGISASDLFIVMRPSQSSHITDPDEAYFSMMSFFTRWIFPKANFELYAEWGRNDDKRRFRDFLAEPELNRGYVLGFLKNFEISSMRRLLLNVEVTNLENSSVTATNRDFNIWYTNPVIGQGFTHKGRVLGAGIGPGSSTQQIHLHYYDTWGMAGVSARRIAHHMDRHFKNEDYFRSFARWPQFYFLLDRHEIEIRYGFDLLLFLPYDFELEAGYRIGKVENRYNLRGVDIDNYQYSFTLRYNFSGFSR